MSYSWRYSSNSTVSKLIASSPSIRSLSTSQLGRLTRSSLRTGRPPITVISRL
jgi:hypothetical protein